MIFCRFCGRAFETIWEINLYELAFSCDDCFYASRVDTG